MASCGEVDHSVDALSSGKKVAGDASSSPSGNGANGPSSPSPSLPPVPECAICLQSCVHPVRLPCRHVFCFLCAKGASWHSRRCALCRQEVPEDFLERPALLSPEELKKAASGGGGGGGRGGGAGSDEHAWYYEGRNGWWQYDERTSRELEDAYARGKKSAEMLIAGFLYVADLENMVQYRRNEHGRRRRMKRDAVDVPKKGVAGLRIEPETLATTTTAAAHGTSADDGERESSADGADARSQPVFAAPPVRPPTSLGAHPVAPVTASASPTASGPDAVVQQFSQLSIGAGPRGAESNEEEEEEEEEEEDEDEDSVAPDASGYESESGTDDEEEEDEEEEEDGGVRRAERERDRNRTREAATATMTDRLSPGDEGEEGGAGVRSRSPDGQCTVTEV